MDARYEPLEQEVFNQLIDLINRYVRENTDEVVTHPLLREDFRDIAHAIYHCSRMLVETDSLLSIKNFLSIDVVPLPSIGEAQVQGLTDNKAQFNKTITHIQSMLAKRKMSHPVGYDFYQQAEDVLFNAQVTH